jgi:membrane fusion protein (multidrug efflux system)
VEVAPVSQRDLTETLLVVGSVAANESTEVRAEVSGLVRRIEFDEGSQVEEGQVLVRLDDRELQAQLRESKARLELAQQTFNRNEALVAQRSVSQADLDRARAILDQTQAEIDSLGVRLDRTVIRAPFDGMIGSRTVSPGDLLNPSERIARLEDLSRLKIEFALPERHADRVEPGARIMIASGHGRNRTELSGQVYFVSPIIDRATRSIEVKAMIDQPPAFLRPGMFIQVEVILAERENALTVPETAILAREGAYLVVLVDTNDDGQSIAAYRPVRLGLRQDGWVEITPLGSADLTSGQLVVAAGVGSLPLFPGARLETRPLRASFTEGLRP